MKDTKHIVLLFICVVFDIIYYEEDIQHWMCVIDYIYIHKCAIICQLKPHFDVIFACITAGRNLFKNIVSRYGSVNEH